MKVRQCIIVACLITGVNSYLYVNRTVGQNVCKVYGGLFSERNFLKNNGIYNLKTESDSNTWNIPDDESLWINGYVEYSGIVAPIGCYNRTSSGQHVPNDGAGVYSCIKTCSNVYRKVLYIGIHTNTCVCFEQKPTEHVSNTGCYKQEPYNFHYHSETSTFDYTTVYFVGLERIFAWESGKLRQCVNARVDGSDIVYATDSCFLKTNISYICAQVSADVNHADCEEMDDFHSLGFCVSSSYTSWLTAKEQCMKYSGNLAPFITPNISLQITPQAKYWIHMFRGYEVVPKFSEETAASSACLAATRRGSKLFLDPDDCAERKRVLCANGLYDVLIEETTGVNFKTSTPSNKQTTSITQVTAAGEIAGPDLTFKWSVEISTLTKKDTTLTRNVTDEPITRIIRENLSTEQYVIIALSIVMVIIVSLSIWSYFHILKNKHNICRTKNINSNPSNDEYEEVANANVSRSVYDSLRSTPMLHTYAQLQAGALERDLPLKVKPELSVDSLEITYVNVKPTPRSIVYENHDLV